MKKSFLLILVLISLCINPQITIPVSAENPSGGTIDGDSIYWENSWGKLEVYPHTVYGEIQQEQYCNATWKLSATDLDIAFRFNFSLIDAHIYELVGEEWVERTTNFKHTIYGGKHIYYVQNVHFDQYETRRFKWNYDVPFNSSGKWDFLAKLSSETIQYALDNDRYVMVDPWWDTGWQYSRQITINSVHIENDLIDFPVLVELPAAVSDLSDSGNSIRFVSFDNLTKYSHDMELFQVGDITYCWVKIPTVNQSAKDDTKLMVYYGNGGASENSTPDVWSNNYTLVYHMEDMNDSTGYYNNMSFANQTTVVSGVISNCRQMGNPSELVTPSTASINNDLITSYSFEMWVKRSGVNFLSNTINKGGSTATRLISASLKSESGQNVFRNEVVESGGGEPDVQTVNEYSATDTWYYVVYSYKDEESVGMKIYVNGSYDSKDSSSAGTQSTVGFDAANMVTGRDLIIGATTSGLYDEIRISRVNRTNSWINATYKNINESDFITVSGVVNLQPSQFTTNATTNITRTNATLNGFMPNSTGFTGTYTYGFWYGTNNPPIDADTNITYGSVTLPSGIGIEFEKFTGEVLTENTVYYVKAWAFNISFFQEAGTVDTFTTNATVLAPTNVVTSIASNSSMEINWTKGVAADTTVIIRKVGSYPVDETDGTEVYNDTWIKHWEEDLTGNFFYRMWSWNDTYGEYSIDSADVEYGALLLSCFNESNPMEALTFNILIKNADGTDVFNGSGLTNINTIDLTDIPLGNNTQMIVNSSGYNQRIYYFDLVANNVYNISFYLPFAASSELYLLHVEDRSEQPLDLVKIQVQRYINTTGIYENVSIVLTDGAGDTLVNLIPNIPYQVTLTKSLYVTQISDYTTSPDVFIKNFVMDRIEDEENVTKFLDTIIFTGEWKLSNNTLHIHYFDKEDKTLDSTFQIWETGNFTEFLNATYEFTTESDIHIYVTGLNLNRTHKIEINLNHTTIGQIVNQPIYVYPQFKEGGEIRNLDWLEQLFENTFGNFEMGYVNFFLIFLPCLSIIIVFAKHPGLGVLGSASYITFISAYMEITIALLGVASLLFTIGIIIIITKRGKKITK